MIAIPSELVSVEFRSFRHRIKLERIVADSMLAQLNSCPVGSFFYKISVDDHTEWFDRDAVLTRSRLHDLCAQIGITGAKFDAVSLNEVLS